MFNVFKIKNVGKIKKKTFINVYYNYALVLVVVSEERRQAA